MFNYRKVFHRQQKSKYCTWIVCALIATVLNPKEKRNYLRSTSIESMVYEAWKQGAEILIERFVGR